MTDSVVFEYDPRRFSASVYFKQYWRQRFSFSDFPIRMYNKMRISRRILVPMVFVVLVIAGFEYYFKWTPFNQHSEGVIVDVGKSH